MNVVRLGCWIVSLLLTTAVRAETFAVIVGVNEVPEFRLFDGTAPRPLQGAEHDARLVAEVLTDNYRVPVKNIRTLLGREADLATVRREFAHLARGVKPDDTVLLHFSGHGTQRPDSLPFDEADELDEALCLCDAAADGTGLLLDDELGRLLEALPANDVVVVLDCCHAGTGTKDDDGIVARFLKSVTQQPRRASVGEHPWRELRSAAKSLSGGTTSFFACRAEQQAYERRLPGVTDRVGQFSYFFWTGLRDAAADADRDGSVSRAEAIAYANGRLNETFNAGRSDPAARQTPTWEGDRPDRPFLP